jgi:hypothetical protein
MPYERNMTVFAVVARVGDNSNSVNIASKLAFQFPLKLHREALRKTEHLSNWNVSLFDELTEFKRH